MATPIEATDVEQSTTCHTDRSCGTSPKSGCGCGSSSAYEQLAPRQRGTKAALLAIACLAVCLAVPLAIGGVVALSGALVGEWWIIAVALVAAPASATVMVRRRGTGPVC